MKVLKTVWGIVEWVAIAILGIYAIRSHKEIKKHKNQFEKDSWIISELGASLDMMMLTLNGYNNSIIPQSLYEWHKADYKSMKELMNKWISEQS